MSPQDLKLAAPYLPKYTTPRIRLRILKSGLPILHTPAFSSTAFAGRLLSLLDLRQALSASFHTAFDSDRISAEREGATTLEIAQMEKLSVGLAATMISEVEDQGVIVRDEQGGEGVRWYRNYIVGFTWKDDNVSAGRL